MSGKYLQRFINQSKVKTYIQTSCVRFYVHLCHDLHTFNDPHVMLAGDVLN